MMISDNILRRKFMNADRSLLIDRSAFFVYKIPQMKMICLSKSAVLAVFLIYKEKL